MSEEPVIDLLRQIACVERELALRKGVYGGLIARGRLSAEKAHYELRAMGAVLETLKRYRDAESTSERSA
jgi:hypothetical protein